MVVDTEVLNFMSFRNGAGNKYNIYMYLYKLNQYLFLIGERAKRARHSQVCSIENRGYIYYILCIVRAIFVLITHKEGGA